MILYSNCADSQYTFFIENRGCPWTVGKVSTKSTQGTDPVYCSLMVKKGSDLFNSALESLHQFCIEMDADWCMVYDFMEAQVGTLTEEEWDQVEMLYHNYNMDSRY